VFDRNPRLQQFDGDAWQDIPETRTADNTDVDWRRQFKPLTTRRIRLLVEESYTNTTRLWELELYEPRPKKP